MAYGGNPQCFLQMSFFASSLFVHNIGKQDNRLT